SLEKRRRKADQDLFIAAVVMNLWIRDSASHNDRLDLTVMGLYNIVRVVCERIRRTTVPQDFYHPFMKYLGYEDRFSRHWMGLDQIRPLAEEQSVYFFMRAVLRILISLISLETCLLIHFAIRLLSFVANSAASECTFSEFSIIRRKRRNRLSLEIIRKMGVLQMD
ncbi:hypothetical protein BDN72DRAFT_742872, partial [Pluteus cervinus]